MNSNHETRQDRPFVVRWSDDDDAYLGSIPGLIGECCHGDTRESVIGQLKDIAEDLEQFVSQNGGGDRL